MRAKLFTRAHTLQPMLDGTTLGAVCGWLARTYAARMVRDTVRRCRKAVDYAGAAKRADAFAARAKALEAENERLKTALQTYQRAAYLTLSQSNAVLDNRVRIDGKWHDLEHRLPWYHAALNELDLAYASVRKLIGEPQFAAPAAARPKSVRAGAVRQRGGADLRIAA